ncbi:NYN domain-containing protein [Suillus cothurnatus]|nr:NYN domain-containing protein [Suillus cothurnatus]
MSNHRKVAIFWDYENCSPPLNSQGHAIVNGLRRIAHVFGYVTSFKAYFDMSSQSSPKSVGFRSDLQSSGVSIIDCPHNGKKEVVDKMILVDMIAFAVDNPSPATIILIAGDRDYAYAVSTLRLRQYNVVLIVPPAPNIPQSLESQASVVVDWNFAILGKPTEANTAPNSDTASGDATQPASTFTPKKVAITTPETPVRPKFESVASRARSATQSTHNVPDVEQGSGSSLEEHKVLSNESLVDGFVSCANEIQDATQDPFARTLTSLERNQNAESGLPSTTASSNFPPSPPPAVTSFNVNLKSPPFPSSSHTRTPGGTPISYDDIPQNAVPVAAPPSTIAIDLIQRDKNVYLRAGVTRFAHYTALAEQASLIQLGGREGDAWITLHPDLFRQDIDSDMAQSSSTPSTSPTPQGDIPYTTPTPSSSATPLPNTASPGAARPSTLNPNAEPFIAVVPIPLCFRPLITCLAKFHTDGIPKPVRSAVGQVLGLAAYSQAGTSSLREYLAQAVYAGVVECGGSGASAWARLHPDVLNGKRTY